MECTIKMLCFKINARNYYFTPYTITNQGSYFISCPMKQNSDSDLPTLIFGRYYYIHKKSNETFLT